MKRPAKHNVKHNSATNHARMAFSRPGGESAPQADSRPLDLQHLSHQTMGDRALEQEVLAMFSRQIGAVRDTIAGADAKERSRLAHALKGSARAVGAFALADCAARIEDMPEDAAQVSRLIELIAAVRDFIAGLSR